ncbi:MAG TPA: DegT/DnrJ/EryC1/StrS family aminotransferase [Solirubrobacterales bacterium]|nr:DegT/DnrJ/EryC1/StrS family aminotransferase [Solirubrobacterales bacterium]
MNEPIPLARPDLGPREEELLLEVVRSGSLSLGPKLDQFEHDFGEWLGGGYAVALSSGTAALHLGVRAMGWGEGDEVITSPFSFVATSNSILYEGATPVFCDIDPVTLNIDPEAAAAAVSDATAGLLPVHIFGYPADLPALSKIASDRALGVLEDAAQALGAIDRQGRKIGTSDDIAVFAFYPNKQMTTGEGGVLVTPDKDVADRVVSERNQGRPAENDGGVEHDRVGFNYRLSDLQAAIGIAQVERLDELLNARENVAALYRERLTQLGAEPAGQEDAHDIVLPCENDGDERRGWFVFVVQLPVGTDRDAVISALGSYGVASKAYLPCIHLLPPYRERFGFSGGEFPVAERVSQRSLALPFFTSMTEGQVDRVCTALGEALGRRP